MDFPHLQMRCLRSQFNLLGIRFQLYVDHATGTHWPTFVCRIRTRQFNCPEKRQLFCERARARARASVGSFECEQCVCANEISKSLFRWFSHNIRCEQILEHDVPLFYTTPPLPHCSICFHSMRTRTTDTAAKPSTTTQPPTQKIIYKRQRKKKKLKKLKKIFRIFRLFYAFFSAKIYDIFTKNHRFKRLEKIQILQAVKKKIEKIKIVENFFKKIRKII